MTSEQKNAIITGGTSGLGMHLVKLFLDRGWKVATLGRRQKELDKLKQRYPEGNLIAVQCDIRIESQVSNFIESAMKELGSVDLCVLNAGTLGPSELPRVSALDTVDLRMTFETNFFANFNLLKGALGLKNGRIAIVHVTSDAVKGMYPGWGAYGASKAAMDFIVSTLQNESDSSEIEAFSFDPGDMDTEMHHLALPDEEGLKDPAESAQELYELVRERGGI